MIRQIVEELDGKGRMEYLEPASDEQIEEFETRNGLVLPAAFKEWLRLSDGGELFLPAGLQIYGVAHKPLIEVGLGDRPDDSYVVIGALASGDPVLCQKGSEQISIYNLEGECIEEDEIYPDFGAFLSDLQELLGIW